MHIEDDFKGWANVIQNGTSQKGGFREGKAVVEARVLLLGVTFLRYVDLLFWGGGGETGVCK